MFSSQQDVHSISVTGIQDAQSAGFEVSDYAEKLNVDLILEGSIRENDTGMTVNIRMVWTADSVAVWRDTIEVGARDRETLLDQVSDTLHKMINKKVARLQKST